MTIKNFSIEYDAINSRNTFTDGDTVNGRIVVEASKETTIQSLVFTAKGKARVKWSQNHGKHHHRVYLAEERYYDVKHILREAKRDGVDVICKGRHVFPFSFKIPERNMPSSFKASIGIILHKLKAELKQSMKLTKKATTHFTFVSKADVDIPGLMEPQRGCKDTSVKVFGSGNVSMDVHTQRMGYEQGEALQVTVEVSNRSTRSVKPKFVLYEKKSFFAQGRRRVGTHEILKQKMESIAPGKETVTTVIPIPRELPPSILNCSILKQEYRLKIHLDLKYAANPEIKFPIVILPSSEVPDIIKPPPAAAAGYEASGDRDRGPWSSPPQAQPADLPPPYGGHATHPPSNYTSAL